MNNNKNNKFKNPLSGLPVRSLIITLSILLVTFSLGFGVGFTCSSCSSDSSFVMPVYAQEVTTTLKISDIPNLSIQGTFYSQSQPFLVRNPYKTSSSEIDFPISALPEAGSLHSVSFWGSPTSFVNRTYLGFDVSCQRNFTDFRNRTSGLPLLRFSRSAFNRSPEGSWIVSQDDYNVLFDLLQGADALSQDTFSFSYKAIRESQSGTVFLPYSLTYLDSSSISFDSLLSERPVYLLIPLFSSFTVIPNLSFGGYSSSFIFDYRLYTSEEANLANNPYVDIRLSFLENDTFAPAVNSVLYNHTPVGLVDYDIDTSLLERYQQGYSDGYLVGRGEGQNVGYDLGYSAGLTAGRSELLEDVTPWQHIVNGVNTFLRLEILPNVRVSVILTITFGLILVGFLLKFYLGG